MSNELPESDSVPVPRREALRALCGISVIGGAGCLRSKRTETSTPNENSTNTTAPRIDRTELGPDTFEHLSDIDVSGGRLSSNSEKHVTGTQCATLETDSTGAALHISMDESIDFERARISCYMAREGSASGTFPYVDLTDADGHTFRTRSVHRSRDRLTRLDFGVLDPEVDDAPVDLGTISEISFRFGPTDESGREVVYLDAPQKVHAPDTPKILFGFDDGYLTDYTEAFPYLSQYGYPAISYVNTDTIGTSGKLNEEQLHELKEAGWLIGSHTTDHTDLSDLDTTAEIETKVRDAKQWLEERGFTEGARHFSYPFNSTSEKAISVVSQYHDTGRVSSWQPVALPSNLQTIPGDGDLSVAELRPLCEQAIAYGGILCLYFHNLQKADALADFQAVVDYVRQKEQNGTVDVISMDKLETLVRNSTE